ncbi:hypothetical protein GUITHDRAFT_119504 [Guillardia theta CCMP2712]|uniref:Uncharacterized protein n=1 Tax=Guillardia theta (strain CCMP2712) TaxID=905079 RepID=L1IDP4_GUITC|nr:hypothetical protein GUITHDRAFT_119504 [Guillardia theta CCMP2712]EKX34338.1 hypothetical protein GUITHDRAFT_119504 [Guillardia theta CCMP2712]|eukprot:XP_005821318.1 hypothetical protein GUITHDRAFT_119504 [Guillardia theta CCMP2712]
MFKLGKLKAEGRPDTAYLNVAIKDLRVKHSQALGTQRPQNENVPGHAEWKKKVSSKDKLKMLEKAKEAELKSIGRGLARPSRSISLIPILRFPSNQLEDFVNSKGSKTERALRPDFRSLQTTVFDTLLDVADISNISETLNMTAPALGALASKKGNRIVLTEAGSVEILMKLLEVGPPASRLDAWMALDDLLRCNDAKKKLFAQPGVLLKLRSCSSSRNHRVRRIGASILRNLVSDRVCCASTRSSGADGWGVQALSVQEKTSEDMVQTLCSFVTCGEDEASVSAGNALFRIAKCAGRRECAHVRIQRLMQTC